MSFIGDITGLGSVATAASEAFKAVPDILGKFIPDPNVRAQAQVELQKVQEESVKAQYDAMSSVMTADSKSDSAYTRAARPTVVYWSLAMVSVVVGASLAGHGKEVTDALASVPQNLWDTIRYSIGIYAAGRSTEKVASTVVPAIVNAIRARKK